MSITAERLREILSYDTESGVFVWKVSRGPLNAGMKAGSVDTRGHLQICIDRRLYQAHRLAWLYVNGKWPNKHIDHINGDKTDNRIANLRDVTHAVNLQNQRRAPSSNKTSGLLGVSWKKANLRWCAQIQVNDKKMHLGLFDTAEAAHAAYVVAKRQLHEGCML